MILQETSFHGKVTRLALDFIQFFAYYQCYYRQSVKDQQNFQVFFDKYDDRISKWELIKLKMK